MGQAFVPLIAALFFLTGIFSILIGFVAWKQKQTPSGNIFAAIMLSIAIWCFSDALEMLAISLETKILCSQISYLGRQFCPVLLLLLAIRLSNPSKRLPHSLNLLLFLPPVIFIILAWTNAWHGYIWANFIRIPDSNLYIYEHGPVFWVMMGWSYSVLGLATINLIAKSLKLHPVYRFQSVVLILAIILPLGFNIIYVTGWSPIPAVDFSGIGFFINAFVLYAVITRVKFLDLEPVSRDYLMENLDIGILVLDQHGRILEFNPTLTTILNLSTPPVIGQNYRTYLPVSHLSLFQEYFESPPSPTNPELHALEFSISGKNLIFQLTYLRDPHDTVINRMLTLRDITTAKQAEQRLLELNRQLNDQLEQIQSLQNRLREEAVRDPLTGLFNRRYLEITLEHEFSRARRENLPISLIMVDIDHFKDLNDHSGHAAGDAILVSLGVILRQSVREGDIACRYGGEEFLLVLPGCYQSSAFKRAEEVRHLVELSQIEYGQDILGITLSCGVATFPQHGNCPLETIIAADKALYSAKAAGRNCTRTAEGKEITELPFISAEYTP